MSNQGYDDDKPKDGKYKIYTSHKGSTCLRLVINSLLIPIEFIFFTKLFKLEEKKIL